MGRWILFLFLLVLGGGFVGEGGKGGGVEEMGEERNGGEGNLGWDY